MSILQKLNKIPHDWAKTAKHYHENELGEYWIASIEGDRIVISGSDIDWDVISLSYEEAIEEKELLSKGRMFFKGYNVGASEIAWILSVIEASLLHLNHIKTAIA